MTARRLFIAMTLVLAIGAVAATTATAQTWVVHNSIQDPLPGDARVVYNNIQRPLPPSVSSEGAESYNYSEFGDGFTLAEKGGTLDKVTLIMVSWACQSGSWTVAAPALGSCVTSAPETTFSWPITVKVYSVVSGTSIEGALAPAPGTLLASATQDFNLPYRPSSDSVNCNGQEWYDPKTETCQYGLAFPITFDLSSHKVKLPKEIIVGFEYNTTYFGPSPVGTGAACYTTSEGCFYDSLNISGGSGTPVPAPTIGAVLDVNGIFVNYSAPNAGGSPVDCAGVTPTTTPTGFELDAAPGCFTGFHPEIRVTVEAHHDEHE